MSILGVLVVLFHVLSRNRSDLTLENLVLRRQLAILHGAAKRPRLRMSEVASAGVQVLLAMEILDRGAVVAVPLLGGLRHRYRRAA